MKRRALLKIFSAGTLAAMGSQLTLKTQVPHTAGLEDFEEQLPVAVTSRFELTLPPDRQRYLDAFTPTSAVDPIQANLESYIAKMKAFNEDHPDDLFISQTGYGDLVSTFRRLERVQNLVGYGNFNVISFDEMLNYSRRYKSVGAFKPRELAFLEEIFQHNAQEYGFFGEKITEKLTAVVPEKARFKVPYTGHFVYRGDSLHQYHKIRKTLGENIILTSGIRSNIKQTYLFLAKTIQTQGNLSRASRSLAPPGHSFHGIGDFDVGKVGFGRKNFTSAFAKTREFRNLVELGFVNIRYPKNNLLGVRFEPWHIKVV